MGKRIYRLAWAITAGTGLVMGCQSANHGAPGGPLLSSKPPVEGKPGASEPVQVADAEPKAPVLPQNALASLPDNREPAASIGLPTGSVRPRDADLQTPANPFRTAVGTRGPVNAIPATRMTPAIPAVSTARPSGKYGHADDYSWVQGVLRKHYHGDYYLRFCDHSVEDSLGGKVCLDRDPLLAQFKDGDIVYVEGTVDHEADPTRHAGWQHYKRYHIRTIKLVEHGN
jgi:hypothetical protein